MVDEDAVGEQVGEVEVGRDVEHRHLDPVAGPGLGALEERREDRLHGHHPDLLVDGVTGDEARVVAGRGDGVGEAAARLEDGVERGLGGERTAGAEPGDEAAHEPRVGGGEHVVGQPERLGDAGAPVGEEHVGVGEELEQRVATRRVLEVEHHRSLRAVAVGEHRAVRRLRPAVPPERVALRGLDLDHVGAEVGEHHPRVRARPCRRSPRRPSRPRAARVVRCLPWGHSAGSVASRVMRALQVKVLR